MRGRLRRALDELAVTIGRTAIIVAQARSRLAGQLPDIVTRLVSLHDPDARPIRKGRIGRPTEFGYKARSSTTTTASSWITTSRPATHPTHLTSRPRSAGSRSAGHRAGIGHGRPRVRRACDRAGPAALGVRRIAIPRRVKVSPARRAVEHARRFRSLVKWRTGSEGRTSYLNRGYGRDRRVRPPPFRPTS